MSRSGSRQDFRLSGHAIALATSSTVEHNASARSRAVLQRGTLRAGGSGSDDKPGPPTVISRKLFLINGLRMIPTDLSASVSNGPQAARESFKGKKRGVFRVRIDNSRQNTV